MHKIPRALFHSPGVLVAAVATLLAACCAGADESSGLVVRGYPSYFTADGRRFASLDALEVWESSTGVSARRIEGCVQGSPNSMLEAAARFQRLYVDLRRRPQDDAECAATAADAPTAMGDRAARESVEEYWLRVAP